MILNEEEKKCIRFLAKCFNENKVFIQRDWAIKQIGVDNNKYDTLMKTMEQIGAIQHVQSVLNDHGYAWQFSPSAYSVQLARQLDLEEQATNAPRDVVEQLKTRARQNPWTARLIIIFLILALLIPLLNSLWELLGKIMSLFSRK